MARIEELSFLGDNNSKMILARELGISEEELEVLDYDIIPHMDNNGSFFGYEVKFINDNSEAILSKIERIYKSFPILLAPWQIDKNFDFEKQLSAIREKKNIYNKFYNEIEDVKKLNQVDFENIALSKILKRQIFISIIGILETFLSETFIQLTDNHEKYLKNFIETHPEFRKRKFDLKDIFIEKEKLKETANTVMMDTIYHNLPQVREMFISTFKIEFPNIETLHKFVLERHDLVHRNGKTKQGESVTVDNEKINNLIKVTVDFVEEIAAKLNLRNAIL